MECRNVTMNTGSWLFGQLCHFVDFGWYQTEADRHEKGNSAQRTVYRTY